jgi:AcrR family transcriptional regulator
MPATAPGHSTTGTSRSAFKAARVPPGAVPERLLLAATRLFAEQGFESTTVQQVVDAAGVTKGAMYHYFDSKDDLLYEVYARLFRVQMARLEQIAGSEESVDRRLADAAGDVIVTTLDQLDDATIFLRSMHQLSPAKQETVRADRRRYQSAFQALVQEGQDSGVFRRDMSAALVVDYFLGAVHHLGIWYRPDGPIKAAEVARSFTDLLMSGLRSSV